MIFHPVYCVFPPDAQQAVLSQQQQAIVNQQAVIMVRLGFGSASVYLSHCSLLPM